MTHLAPRHLCLLYLAYFVTVGITVPYVPVAMKAIGFTGDETFTIQNVEGLKPRQDVDVIVKRADGSTFTFTALCRIDTINELEYFLNGGILQYVLRKLAA